LVHDTLLQLQNAGGAIRRPLKVHFIGEEGVDEGGVQKARAFPPSRRRRLDLFLDWIS
jgi:hypothetical protein